MDEPVFLSREQVLELHRISLQLHGGLDGLREPGTQDSALMQPEAAFFYGQRDLAAIAAAYAFHIAQNQLFLDGNKRTAMASAPTFVDRHRREAPRQGRPGRTFPEASAGMIPGDSVKRGGREERGVE